MVSPVTVAFVWNTSTSSPAPISMAIGSTKVSLNVRQKLSDDNFNELTNLDLLFGHVFGSRVKRCDLKYHQVLVSKGNKILMIHAKSGEVVKTFNRRKLDLGKVFEQINKSLTKMFPNSSRMELWKKVV